MRISYLIALLVFAGGLLFFGCLEPQPPVVNNTNGSECAAGYSWCDVLQKCIKLEENCTIVDETEPDCGFAGCPPIGNYSNITNFDECVAAGYPILKTNPPRCEIPDNRTFVQNLMNQTICETGGGYWFNCSTGCVNTGAEIQCNEYRCIAHCQCGGLAGFRCPEGFYCTDYYPEWTSDAIGICRPISELIDDGKN